MGVGVSVDVGSGVDVGVGSRVGVGVGSGVGVGVGVGVGSLADSRIGAGVGSGVGVGIGSRVGSRVGIGVGAGAGAGASSSVMVVVTEEAPRVGAGPPPSTGLEMEAEEVSPDSVNVSPVVFTVMVLPPGESRSEEMVPDAGE